jgi:hypothetical protein
VATRSAVAIIRSLRASPTNILFESTARYSVARNGLGQLSEIGIFRQPIPPDAANVHTFIDLPHPQS